MWDISISAGPLRFAARFKAERGFLHRAVRGVASILLLSVSACAATPPPCAAGADAGEPDTVYVVSRGWHVEVGLAADRLDGPLGAFRDVFPGARAVMFGYGKRTFFTAKADTVSEYILGPVPGPAAIQVAALSTLPTWAYEPGAVMVMHLPPGGAKALSAFLWDDFERDETGAPRLIAPGNFPGSLFYAARSGYSLGHTCNRWAADALHAAGLPLSGKGVVFSGQVVSRAVEAHACAPASP